VAVRRVAGNPDGVGQEVVRYGGHRALEHFGQAEIRVKLVPERARHRAAGESVRQDELLADIHPALQDLGLHALQFRVALQQRLEAGRVLLPQALPQRDRVVGGFELAIDRRLALARIAARKLGMQIGDELAQHFGDRRALARGERRDRHRLQLAEHRFADEGDALQRQRIRPSLRGLHVGECEGAQFAVGTRRRIRARSTGR